jgi:hypothetical protein
MDMETVLFSASICLKGAKNLKPFFTDNRSVYFLSNRDGFRKCTNMWWILRSIQMTRFFTGITGITEYSPAISVARTKEQVVIHIITAENTHLFSHSGSFKPAVVSADSVNFDAAHLPPFSDWGQYSGQKSEYRDSIA